MWVMVLPDIGSGGATGARSGGGQEERVMRGDLNADLIVTMIKELGVHAYVAQTGGGCATIYAGPQRMEPDYGTRWHTVAGPGTYGWGQRASTMTLWELWVGADDNGLTEPTDAWQVGCRTERDVANLIVTHVRHRDVLGAMDPEVLRALGFSDQLVHDVDAAHEQALYTEAGRVIAEEIAETVRKFGLPQSARDYAETFVMKALALKAVGDYGQAIEYLNAAVVAIRKSAEAHAHMAAREADGS